MSQSSRLGELSWIAEARTHIGLREVPGPKTNSVISGWLAGVLPAPSRGQGLRGVSVKAVSRQSYRAAALIQSRSVRPRAVFPCAALP